jgi:hypothetical protein
LELWWYESELIVFFLVSDSDELDVIASVPQEESHEEVDFAEEAHVFRFLIELFQCEIVASNCWVHILSFIRQVA